MILYQENVWNNIYNFIMYLYILEDNIFSYEIKAFPL